MSHVCLPHGAWFGLRSLISEFSDHTCTLPINSEMSPREMARSFCRFGHRPVNIRRAAIGRKGGYILKVKYQLIGY